MWVVSASRLAVLVVLTALVGGSLLVAGPAGSEPPRRFEHRFRIDSERVAAGPLALGAARGVARGSYSLEMRDGGSYTIRGGMRGTHFAYKTRLTFRVDGRFENGAWVPSRYFAQIQHDSVLAEDRTRSTAVDFDYAHGRAFARTTSEKEGRKRVLFDTRPAGVAIDRGVKDPISALMDVITTDRAGEVPIRTVVGGVVVTYRVRDLGRQSVAVGGAPVPCRVRSLSVPGGAIDEHPYVFTIWSREGNGRHVLQARIAPAGSSLVARYERTIQ